MPIDLSKCYETENGDVLTCEGRLSYTQYLLNGQENKKGKVMYQLNLLVPPSSDLKLLKNKMAVVGMKNTDNDETRTKKLVGKRFLDPRDLPGGGKPYPEEFEGWVLIRASSSFIPDFIHPNGNKMSHDQAKTEAYSGRWARVSLSPYWSNNEENKGIFLGLGHVQLLKHDDVLGASRPSSDGLFDAIDVESGESNNSTNSTDETVSIDDMF